MTRVKICGLTREADLDVAVAAGADAVGVVCDVPVDSPRAISSERAKTLLACAPPFVTTALVTMPRGVTHAIELVEQVRPDVLQIHAGLDRAGLSRVADAVDCRLVVGVDADTADSMLEEPMDDVADALIVDTVDESGGGGTGTTHDWERTREAMDALDSPVILAGGLTPSNVAEAVRTVDPFAVDVATGVEARGGVKDAAAVRSFVDRAKAKESSCDESTTDRSIARTDP